MADDLIIKLEKVAFLAGVQLAARIADTYNSTTTHEYRLGDCIMSELNMLPKGKRIRRNKQKLVSILGHLGPVRVP